MDRISESLARIEERLQAHERIHVQEEKARIAALGVLTKDLESLNDVRTRFIPRDVFDARVGQLERFQSRLLGMGILGAMMAGMLGGVIGHLVK